MSVQITIRNVPDEVRNELASRAALAGKSMQEYLRGELERLVSKPTVEAWMAEVREHKKGITRRIRPADILRARDADRK